MGIRRGGRLLVTATATVAAAAAAVAWPLGHWRAVVVFGFGPDGRPAVVCATSGSFRVLASNAPTGSPTAWTVDVVTPSRTAFEADWARAVDDAEWQWGDTVVGSGSPYSPPVVTHGRSGLAVGRGHDLFDRSGSWYAYAAAPAWLVVPALAVVPVRAGWRAAVRRRRRRAGACLGCGYDLRGSPDRCPECGRWRDGSAGVPASAGRDFVPR